MRCLLGLFVWPVGSHLVWMMAAVRVPLASVTPTMAAWSHVEYSASCSGCVALQRAWLIVAEVSTSLARTMLNAVRASATLATTMADHGKQQLDAAGYLDCGSISPTVASVTEYLWRAYFWVLCVGCCCTGWQTVVRVILVIKAALTAGAASYQSGGVCWLGRGCDEHNHNKCSWVSKSQLSIVYATLFQAAVGCGADKLQYSCNLDTHWWACSWLQMWLVTHTLFVVQSEVNVTRLEWQMVIFGLGITITCNWKYMYILYNMLLNERGGLQYIDTLLGF